MNQPIHEGKNIVYAFVFGQPLTDGHWVAVLKEPDRTVLIDPYGFDNDENYFIPYLQENHTYSVIKGQRFNQPYCGEYCVGFFKLLQSGVTWEEAVKQLFPESGKYRNNYPNLIKLFAA